MPHEKKLAIKFYFLVAVSVALVPALLVLWTQFPGETEQYAAAQGGSPAEYAVEGWAGGWSTDSAGTNLYVNTNPSGPGWIAFGPTTSTPREGEWTPPGVSYGLKYVATGAGTRVGYLDGYIWSRAFGWIHFNPLASSCPIGGCDARVDASGRVHGWARILSIAQAGGDTANCGDAGGWAPNDCYKGWIKLGWEFGDSGIDWSTDGLRLGVDGSVTGYGWSNEFGWIRFTGRTVAFNLAPSSCLLTADPKSVEVSQSRPTATTTIAWLCRYVNDDCRLTPWVKGSGVGTPVATSSPAVLRTLSETTIYEIECTSAWNGAPVKGSDVVTVRFPSKIIECNPNSPDYSPDCK